MLKWRNQSSVTPCYFGFVICFLKARVASTSNRFILQSAIASFKFKTFNLSYKHDDKNRRYIALIDPGTLLESKPQRCFDTLSQDYPQFNTFCVTNPFPHLASLHLFIQLFNHFIFSPSQCFYIFNCMIIFIFTITKVNCGWKL